MKYITTCDEYSKLLEKLEKAQQIAVDLEFDNNSYHYGFKLCLMQIYFNGNIYLIDPQFVDIKKIFSVFENENIEKVVFSFGEDIKLLNNLGCRIRNIYDISIAVRLLNYEKFSLANIVWQEFEKELEKTSQRSDWCRRPFTDKQLKYAAADVLYLIDLKNIIEKKAKEKNIDSWISEENKALENNILQEYPGNIINKKVKRNLTEFQWFLYERLWQFREKKAKELDKPPHQVIDNNFLLQIAENPQLIKNWKKNKYIHRSLKNDYVARELEILYKSVLKEASEKKLSKKEPALKPPLKEERIQNRKKRDESEKIKEEIFKPVQNSIREKYGEYAVTFILSNKLMDELIRGDKSNLKNYKRKLLLKYGGNEIIKYL